MPNAEKTAAPVATLNGYPVVIKEVGQKRQRHSWDFDQLPVGGTIVVGLEHRSSARAAANLARRDKKGGPVVREYLTKTQKNEKGVATGLEIQRIL